MVNNSLIYLVLVVPSLVLVFKGLKGLKNNEVWRPISFREFYKINKRGIGTTRSFGGGDIPYLPEKQIFGHAAKKWSIIYLSIGVICLTLMPYLFINDGPVLLFYLLLLVSSLLI